VSAGVGKWHRAVALLAGGGAHCTSHPPAAAPSTRCPPTQTGKIGVYPTGHATAPAAHALWVASHEDVYEAKAAGLTNGVNWGCAAILGIRATSVVGRVVGCRVGWPDGAVGRDVGCRVGCRDGWRVGCPVGCEG